jgi:hypothetical protein
MGRQDRVELRVRRTVENSLEALFLKLNLQQLSGIAEHLLNEIMAREVLEEISAAAKGRKKTFIPIGLTLFQFGTSIYELRIERSASFGRRLDVVIDRRNSDQLPLIGTPMNPVLEAVGRVKEFCVLLPATFEAQREAISAIVKTVVETGYRLLKVHIENGIEDAHKGAPHELYRHLRGLLPAGLTRHVRFNVIADSQGVYLLDREAFQASVQIAEHQNFLTCRSALEVVTDVCLTPVPFDQMFSKEALKKDTWLEVDLMRAKYAPTGTHLSEMALYGSNHAVVQPLTHNERTSLVASYPSAFRSQIEPILTSDRTRFEKLTQEHSSGFRDTLERVASNAKKPMSQALETGSSIVGAFAGAYTAELLHHLK